MNKSTTAKSAVRQPRRALLLASGLVAATSILAGAGPASAGFGFPGPVIVTADSPTSASCSTAEKCIVWDKNGIDRIVRYEDAWHASTSVLSGSPTQATVENTGGVYVEFEVIDKLGSRTMFDFPLPA
jgi:hypothetical protein